MASNKGVDFTTYHHGPRDEPTKNPKAEAGCSSSSLKEDQSRSSSSNPKAEAGCSSSSLKEHQSRSSSLKTKRKKPFPFRNGSKTVAQESYSAESINSTPEFKKQKVLGYGCNYGEGEREAPPALKTTEAPISAVATTPMLFGSGSLAQAQAGHVLDLRVPVETNTQASESQEQLAAETKARLDSEAKLAEVLKKNQELQHALDYSLRENRKLEEDFNAQVATLSKERDAEREQAIFLCRGLAKAVRSSMESAGAVMLDTEPDYRSPEEWARLAEQYLKYRDDIGETSSKLFAVTAVMACAATVAIGLKDTSLGAATACLQAGFPQNAFSAVRGKQQALKTAAENFVYAIAKTIEAAKNQNNGERC